MATSNPKIQIEVAVDASGVTEGVNQAKRDIASLPQELQTQADKTATAFKKTEEAAKSSGKSFREAFKEQAAAAKEAEQAVAKSEKVQRTFASQLQRNQNEFIKQTQGQEALAKSLGVTDAALLSQARAFDAQRAALQRGGRELDKFGNTAKQTAAALRQVPAQFTDIVVSLQGGQAPLTVLLQQGGQLKDIFGSAGAAAQALGGYIAGLVNPFTVAAAAAGGLFLAYEGGRRESEAFAKAIILTGNAAGTSVGQLNQAAVAIDAIVGTQGKAAESLNLFVAAGVKGASSLQEFTAAAIRFEKVTGQAVADTAKQFADLGKDPLQGIIKLNEGMNFLTSSTYEQIKSLTEQGRATEAANVAQKAFADTLNDRATQIQANLGLVERGWGAIKSAVTEAWDAIKGIGRDIGPEGQLAATNTAIAELERGIAGRGRAGFNTQLLDAELARLKEKQSLLQSEARLLRQASDAQRERAELVKLQVKVDAELAAGADKSIKMQREVSAAKIENQRLINAGLLTEEDARKRIAAIEAKYAEKGGRTPVNREAEEARKRDLEVVKTRNELVEKSYIAQIKFEQDLAKSIANTVAEREKETAKVEDQVQRERDVAAAIGLTKEQVAELTAAKYEDVAAGLERQAIDEEMLGYSARLVEETRKQAKAFRELAAAKRETGRKEAQFDADKEATKQAEAATKEWMKAAADIEKSITDALFRAFESGKGFVQALRDTIVNAFKTMVLRPIVQAIVSPVAGAITGALGLHGAANAGSGALGTISNLNSLYNTTSRIASFLGIGAATGTGLTAAAGTGLALTSGATGLGLTAGAGTGLGLASGASGLGLTASAGTGTALTGAAGGGLSGALAAIPGWGLALGALALLAGSGFGRTPGEQTRGGFASTRGMDATMENALRITGSEPAARDLIAREDAGLKTFAQTTVDGVLEAANARAQKLGLNIALGIDAGFAANLNGKAKNRNAFGYAQIFANDQLVGEFQNRALGEDVAKAGAAFTKQLLDEVSKALLAGSDIQAKEVTAFDQTTGQFVTTVETASQTLDRLAGSLTAVNETFDALGLSLFDASLAGADAASNFVDLVGGLDQFQNLTRSYYENFYTEGERAAFAMQQISAEFAALGQTLPGTREEFRALVEAARAAGDDTLLANLLKLGPAFASVNASVTKALAGLRSAADQFNLNAGKTTELSIAQAQQAAALKALKDQLPGFDASGFSEADIQRYLTDAKNSGEFQAILGTVGIGLAEAYLVAVNNVNRIRQAAAAGSGGTTGSSSSANDYFSELQRITDAALDGLRRAISTQRELAELSAESARAAIDAIRAVFDVIDASLRELYRQSPAVVQQSAAQARALIAQSINSGVLPDSGVLSNAIDDVQRGFEQTAYTTAFEAERDRLRFAAELSRLRVTGGDQLSLAELQLKAAEDQLESLQAQLEAAEESVNVLRGIDTSVKSVSDAIAALTAAVLAEKSGAGTATPPPAGGTGGTVSRPPASSGSGGFVTGPGGGTPSGTIEEQIARLQAEGKPYHVTNLPGVGIVVSLASSFENQKRIPGFAFGGYHTGGLRLVGENGPELEVTGPSRIFNADQTRAMMSGGDKETVAELKALREDNRAQASALVKMQTQMNKILSRWDAGGMPEQRVTA